MSLGTAPSRRNALNEHGLPSSHSFRSATSSAAPPRPPPSLANRMLQPNAPLSPLPPIFSSSDAQLAAQISRLNDETYELVAIALRAYVGSWWTKVSTRDKEFIPAISLVLAHVLRSLEARALSADLPVLLLDGIPTLLTQHYRDYHAASLKVDTSYAWDASLSRLFHYMQPHIAVSEEGVIEDIYLRQAIDHVLHECLPERDWDSEMERTIVREIIVRPILGSVLPKLSQPWFLHNIVLSLIGKPRPLGAVDPPPVPPPAFQFQDLIVTFLTFIQSASTLCLQIIAFVQSFLHLTTIVNEHAALNPQPSSASKRRQRGNLADPLVGLAAEMLSMQRRATSSAILSILQLITGFFAPFLNRLLIYLLSTYLFTPSRLTSILITTKTLLFPDGYPGPPPIVPSEEEQVVIRDTLERRLLELIPSPLVPYLLGPSPAIQRSTLKGILDPLSSSACNAHLVMVIFDHIVLCLFPEMGVGGVDGIDDGRGSVDGDDEVGLDVGSDVDSRMGGIQTPKSEVDESAQIPQV